MFAGHETVSKTVSFFTDFGSQSIVTDSLADIRPLGARQEAPCPRKTSGGNHRNPREGQGQG